MAVYDVALWSRFQGRDLPYSSEAVEAASSFEAIVMLMNVYRLERVAYAAARSLPGTRIERWMMGRGFWVALSSKERGGGLCL
jgi:hypothetical protein